jgi:vacuolar-type H+-ATPase subunit H
MSASHTPTEPADRRPEPEALQHVSLGNLVIMSGAGAQRLTGKRCRKANGVMPEASPAQSTLKRLIEAEEQAREALKAAEDHAQETIAQAREQAKQSVEAARRETTSLLKSRLEEAESKAATELKQRLEQAEAQAREIERRAKEHFSQAVEMVVDWVTNRGAIDRGK